VNAVDLDLWYAARAAALAAFVVLCAALLTGMALRTALLVTLARNRALLSLHRFLSWFWVPLVAAHVVALLLDGTARIGVLDIIVPFRVAYAPWAVGLGTISLLLLLIVGLSSAMQRRMSPRWWHALHRLAYPMVVLFVVHAQLAGSDFSRLWISLLGWATAGGLAMLALVSLAGGRLGARPEPEGAP